MMFYYKKQSYKEIAYGEDAAQQWFGTDKPALIKKNSLANLPYIKDAREA